MRGHVPGIYRQWTQADKQLHDFTDGYYASYDDIDSAIDFMKNNGDFTEDTINVYGPRGGSYNLHDWIRQH